MPEPAAEKAFWRNARTALYALDKKAGAIVFGSYKPISYFAALARDRGQSWGCVLCRALDWLDPSHCDDALVNNTSAAPASTGGSIPTTANDALTNNAATTLPNGEPIWPDSVTRQRQRSLR